MVTATAAMTMKRGSLTYQISSMDLSQKLNIKFQDRFSFNIGLCVIFKCIFSSTITILRNCTF